MQVVSYPRRLLLQRHVRDVVDRIQHARWIRIEHSEQGLQVGMRVRYFGIEQTAGTVTPGRRADLVLLDANPLTDIGNVRRIHAVVAAGRLLDRKDLDDVLAQVKSAAAKP